MSLEVSTDTSHIPLTLEADLTQIIKWLVDASYATYDDMKSHTEVC